MTHEQLKAVAVILEINRIRACGEHINEAALRVAVRDAKQVADWAEAALALPDEETCDGA